jgi:hypothetical protein
MDRTSVFGEMYNHGHRAGRVDALNEVLDLLVVHNLYGHPVKQEVRKLLWDTLGVPLPETSIKSESSIKENAA